MTVTCDVTRMLHEEDARKYKKRQSGGKIEPVWAD
jgi:hypothetical protein